MRNVRRIGEPGVGVKGLLSFQEGFPGWGNQTVQRPSGGSVLSGFRNSVGDFMAGLENAGDPGGR